MKIDTLKKIGITFTVISAIIGSILELGDVWKKVAIDPDAN